jgi:RsiW-degrading membrane proteinase PrsW (M82 family)
MDGRRDPVEQDADPERDLYDVATWERRTALDTVAAGIWAVLVWGGRGLVVLLAAALLFAQVVAGGMSDLATDPFVLALVVLSILPAAALVFWVRRADVTSDEPVWLLGVTFLLGVLTAMFGAVLNSFVLAGLGLDGLGALPFVLSVAFFFLVVGPVEETVKLLAVRLYAFGNRRFDSVVDGAVYGAVAGLGFATLENLLYITRAIDGVGGAALIGAGGGIAAVRALAGPGHVIYSAFAGYYLGLAKFNRPNGGPIVVKGLIIAAVVHGTYNTLVGVVPGTVASAVGLGASGAAQFVAFVAFVVVFDGLLGFALYRKLRAYADHYREVRPTDRAEDDVGPELTEFDRGVE